MNEKFPYFLDQILKNGDLHPHLMALEEGISKISFAQLKLKVEKKAALLKRYGISPGERIVYSFENGTESVVNYLSILASGATAVLLDPQLSKEDLRALILRSEPVAAIGSPDDLQIPDLPFLKIEDLSCEGTYKKPTVQEPPDPEVATILYTSGTTGDYKGVLLTHENLSCSTEIAKLMCEIPIGPGASTQCFLPIYHVFPLVVNIIAFLSMGASVSFYPVSDVGKLLQAGILIKTTIVPRVLEILNSKIQQLSLLTKLIKWLQRKWTGKIPGYFVCGGSPFSTSIHKRLLRLGFFIQYGYGLTEAGSVGTIFQGKCKIGSVGKVVSHTKIRIDHPNEAGEGEICLQGKAIMKGYFKDPVSTREVLKNGWLHTGDLGFLDAKGNLFLTGRIKEIIVLPSGKKAMPTDVENHYLGIRGIKELAVVGIQPKNRIGEEIHAAVVPESPEISLKEIEKEIFARSKKLEAHLAIQKVHLVDQIPKTTTLKPKRALLKKRLSEDPFIRKVKRPVSSDPIHQWIGNWLVKNTDLNITEIDETDFFHSLGLDSLKMIQFCEDLEQKYQLDISLLDLYDHPNIQTLSEFCKLNQGTRTKTKIPPITPVDSSQPQPLSFIEESIWKYGRGPSANFLMAFDFFGPLDLTAMKRAIKDLFKRHQILRTTYTAYHRQIHPEWNGTYEFLDLSHQSPEEQTASIKELAKKKQIDPSNLPLFFLTIVKLSENHHLWVLLTSRLILDGSSFYLLFDDLSLLYKNHLEKIPTPPLDPPINYADFAAWQKTHSFPEQKAYWEKAFKTMEPLSLPNAKKTLSLQELTQSQNTLQKEIPFILPELLCRQLEGIATYKNSSLQTLLFAAYQVALYKFTKQTTFTSRIVAMGRRRSQLQSLIGHLAGSLPIQTDFTKDLPFDTFLLHTQKKLTEAVVHSDIMGETLVELYGHLCPKPPQISFNVSFNYYSFAKPLFFPHLKAVPHQLPAENYLYPPGLDLDCTLMPINNEIYGTLCYRQVLFDEATLSPLLTIYQLLLNQIAHQPSIRISQFK